MIKEYFKKLKNNSLHSSIKRESMNYATMRLIDNYIFLYVNGHIADVREENTENFQIISNEMNNRRASYMAICYANNTYKDEKS